MQALEAPWQNGMVERHSGVLGDIIEAVVQETSPIGYNQMCDVCLHASMAKNRRPGRTGFSPRALVFGCDERLIASGLNHYLEQPDDAAISASTSDTAYKRSIDFPPFRHEVHHRIRSLYQVVAGYTETLKT